MRTNVQDIKQAAHQLIDRLPDTATWDELAYQMEVRASIERGLADSQAGRLVAHDGIKKQFGVTE